MVLCVSRVDLFLLPCNIPLCKYSDILIHSTADEYLHCFQFLAIWTNANINICIGIS